MENKRSEEIAANRLKVIVPHMDATLDKDKRQLLKEEICIQTGLSERTIRRYLNDYKGKVSASWDRNMRLNLDFI